MVAKKPEKKRKYLSQSDVPTYSLEQALRIAETIASNYASEPTKPLHVATALEMAPGGGHFRALTGSSIAYGITDGGYNASEISLTELGKRIVKPLIEGDDFLALREALLRPKVIGDFLRKYDGSPFPAANIAENVLADMGVPQSKAAETFQLILESAKKYDLTQEIKGKIYGDLSANSSGKPQDVNEDEDLVDKLEKNGSESKPDNVIAMNQGAQEGSVSKDHPDASKTRSIKRHVFITHGKDTSFIEPIKKLLAFGELVPIVSVEKQSVSKPVPEKVMDDMRQCGAAIIHIGQDQELIDSEANKLSIINSNVLIEIGAAMALYGRRFILLVKDGITLPSNLQGLYKVIYSGDSLDGDATIKLLEAINDMKKQPLPDD